MQNTIRVSRLRLESSLYIRANAWHELHCIYNEKCRVSVLSLRGIHSWGKDSYLPAELGFAIFFTEINFEQHPDFWEAALFREMKIQGRRRKSILLRPFHINSASCQKRTTFLKIKNSICDIVWVCSWSNAWEMRHGLPSCLVYVKTEAAPHERLCLGA